MILLKKLLTSPALTVLKIYNWSSVVDSIDNLIVIQLLFDSY
jgi:hypothetical protein